MAIEVCALVGPATDTMRSRLYDQTVIRNYSYPLLVLALAACAGVSDLPSGLPENQPDAPVLSAATPNPTDEDPGGTALADPSPPSESGQPDGEADPAQLNPRVDDPNAYRIPRMLPLDGIAPVYDPQFVSAAEAPLLDEELVIGIQHQGEAKAYPITVLRFREMVNDEIGDWPVLVTW